MACELLPRMSITLPDFSWAAGLKDPSCADEDDAWELAAVPKVLVDDAVLLSLPKVNPPVGLVIPFPAQ